MRLVCSKQWTRIPPPRSAARTAIEADIDRILTPSSQSLHYHLVRTGVVVAGSQSSASSATQKQHEHEHSTTLHQHGGGDGS